jgi:hypothetical protein
MGDQPEAGVRTSEHCFAGGVSRPIDIASRPRASWKRRSPAWRTPSSSGSRLCGG